MFQLPSAAGSGVGVAAIVIAAGRCAARLLDALTRFLDGRHQRHNSTPDQLGQVIAFRHPHRHLDTADNERHKGAA